MNTVSTNAFLRLCLVALGWAATFITDCEAQTRPNSPTLYGSTAPSGASIDISEYGAIGDGVTDDTIAIQKALTRCSNEAITCKVPAQRTFLIRAPLFIWGNANLTGTDSSGAILFSVESAPYLLNAGISGPNKLEKPFSGRVTNVHFRVSGGRGGRVIFFWRTRNAFISDNTFDVGSFGYSATSSGNNAAWVKNSQSDCIRENITISGNTISATATNAGSEGIGLESFDGATIIDNNVTGVGDDAIGIHFSKHVVIKNNRLKSTHGRLFVSNSQFVEIANNEHERIASLADGRFYFGIALIYVGFESYTHIEAMAPSDIQVHDNVLRYPPGAIDGGGAIYIYGPRGVVIERNRVINDSALTKASALHLLPAAFSVGWADPEHQDPADAARVWEVSIQDNSSEGTTPLPFRMTGNCKDYRGPVQVRRNTGPEFVFYCPNHVQSSENKSGTQTH